MHNSESGEQFLSGGGEMGELIRSMDWSQTALGPVNQWPQSLRTTVSLCLSSTFPILIAWGPEMIQIYNDSYRPICGAKHPESMGQNFKICWETALPVVGDAFDRGLAGEGTYIKDQQMVLDRFGYLEEAFMTFSFAPIRDESGEVGGIFHPITETTDKMLSARRTQLLRDVALQLGKAKNTEQIFERLFEGHENYGYDIPFIQIYEVNEIADEAILKGEAGISEKSVIGSPTISLQDAGATAWPLALVLESQQMVEVKNLASQFGAFKSGPFQEAPHTALIFPILIAGQPKPSGFLVAGVSSGRMLDQEYRNFFELLSNTINTAFSSVYAYEQEQKRAEQLAEIDRAKTAFFSNVSHEFRTPLTLILGPLEELLLQPEMQKSLYKNNLESTQRNALRLLKLVNNLLDFSRMEAGRVKAVYQCVNLNALTADLTSNFRSIIEKAGMELVIRESALSKPVYVDTEMWEKIVLNLLSNAFKYTLKGGVYVELFEEDDFAFLKVRDTGVGIPEKELPHMFERFHRIENSLGRTHEGTGIGLSLVNELVRLHHGEIGVSSVEGEGSVFTVKIPLGKNHLPAEQISEIEINHISKVGQGTFLKEAVALLDENEISDPEPLSQGENFENEQSLEIQKDVRVLIVDDNADMRQYLSRLLSPFFTIETAVNGRDAIDKALVIRPDVIVSDIMMPVMDGKEMLKFLKAEYSLEHVAVIFLSARAGEEARIEGIDWGADDYLVKPFSARELLTKVRAQVRIYRARTETESKLRNIFLQAPVAIGIFRGPGLVIELANAMMLQYWGKTAIQVIGKPFRSAFQSVPSDGFDQVALDVLKTGKRKVLREWLVEITRFHKIKKLYLNLTFEALKDQDEIITGVMVIANDVTELVTSMDFIKDSEERFRLLADSMPQLVWTISKSREHNFYNSFVFSYSGLNREDLKDVGLIQLIHPDDRDANLEVWNKSMETGEDFIYEHRYRRHDGQYRWHLSRGVAQRNASNEIERWVGSSMDIHEQKTLEEKLENHVAVRTAELKKVNEQLVQTNRELEQFAYVSSHDLQEPLRKIQVFSDLIMRRISGDDPQNLAYLNKINASASRMSILINDLLSFSRIANGQLKFVETDLNTILNNVKEDFELLADQKTAAISSDVLPVIEAVPLQINHLFYNLIGNALKFSKEDPRINVSYEFIPSANLTDHDFLTPGKAYAHLTFQDNGIGFEQQYADQIFTIFQRLHTKREYSGTGIGLAICKRIAENHLGVIRAKGEPNKGASFDIYLPFYQAEHL
ncbi:ATP-binding protein [Dyadobacter psychrotolerans]|uniref:histidine kinase n=1 Tax=Dyadobacter psychrotolerans TaxID=2541721 RepID=A0A4R5DH84_9BACT|nr:ATP-binding protein [Dyadobacter psychrotolerans]TDE11281.1 response regulator [Dyadobacter psychrotolerans]